MCKVWSGFNAIHVILKKLRNKYNLKWLRISMSYHKFSNLGEIFQGDLNKKLMNNITSKDFMDLDCNCRRCSTVNGRCIYGGKCRKSIVIYKATCKDCGCYYIGNTQQKLKLRMNTHFSETRDLINNGNSSDSFAKHFASHFKDKNSITRNEIRNITNIEIIWQGNPISCIKSFKKPNCSLCNRERLEIYKAMKNDKENNTNFLINSSNELYGACRHNPRFHRYCSIVPQSTDEAKAEKVEEQLNTDSE